MSRRKNNRNIAQQNTANPKPNAATDSIYFGLSPSAMVRLTQQEAERHLEVKMGFAPTENDGFLTPFTRPVEDRYQAGADPWIRFGADNLYPNKLYNLLDDSPHETCVNKKAAFIYGNGIDWDRAHPLAVNLEKELNDIVKKDDYIISISDLIKKTIFDYIVFGTYSYYCSFACEQNTLGVLSNQKVRQIYTLDPMKVRLERPCRPEDEPRAAYVCPDWTQVRGRGQSLLDAIEFPLFNGVAKQSDIDVYYYRGTTRGGETYPRPSYKGAIADIQSHYELSLQRYSMIHNNYGIIMHVKVPLNMGVEERNKWVREFENQYLATITKGNHSVYTFSEGRNQRTGDIDGVVIEYLTPTYPYQTQDSTEKSLLISIAGAHGLPPALMGFTGESSIGSDGNLFANNVIVMEATQINQDRERCLEGIKSILAFNGLPTDLVNSIHFKTFDFKTLLGLNSQPKF